MLDLQYRRLRLRSPLRTARGAIADRDVWVVRWARDGGMGWGEAAPLPGAGTESVDRCAEALQHLARRAAEAPAEPDAWAVWLRAEAPDAPAARFGVDLALWDARARRLGQPLAVALGGAVRAVAANALLGGPTTELGMRAAAAAAAGFRRAKLKVAATPDEDEERVRAVRLAAPTLTLRLDANGGWADATEAQRRLARLAALAGPGFEIEQPVPRTDLAGLGAVARAGHPVAADESVRTRADAEACLDAGVRDLVLKPMRIGGVADTLAIAALARARGGRAWLTTTIDGAIATAATGHLAAVADPDGACEHGLATADLLASDVAAGLELRLGALQLLDAPGHGVAPEAW